jgi:hypothetical protein
MLNGMIEYFYTVETCDKPREIVHMNYARKLFGHDLEGQCTRKSEFDMTRERDVNIETDIEMDGR